MLMIPPVSGLADVFLLAEKDFCARYLNSFLKLDYGHIWRWHWFNSTRYGNVPVCMRLDLMGSMHASVKSLLCRRINTILSMKLSTYGLFPRNAIYLLSPLCLRVSVPLIVFIASLCGFQSFNKIGDNFETGLKKRKPGAYRPRSFL